MNKEDRGIGLEKERMKPAYTILAGIVHALNRWLHHTHLLLRTWLASIRKACQSVRSKASLPIRIISEIPILRLAIVVPLAVLIWLLVERIAPSILQFLLDTEIFVTVFLSHFFAVLSAAYIAPRIYSRQAILVIAIIFISVRLIMGIALLSEQQDSNYLSLVIDVLSALAGLALGALWFFHRTRSKANQP